MEENLLLPEQKPKQKRPQLLSVLCILTYISTGITLFGTLLILLFPDLMVSIVNASKDFDAQTKTDTITALQAGGGYYLTMLLLNILSLAGAIFMWNLKKIGFHFYTIANIFIFNLPILWLGLPFSLIAAFFPAVFIGLYAMHLKFME